MPIQYETNIVWSDKVIVQTAKHMVEGEFLAETLYPLKSVEGQDFYYETVASLISQVAPIRAEKAEAQVFNVSLPTLTAGKCKEVAYKELITKEALRGLKIDAVQYAIQRLSQSIYLTLEKNTFDEIMKAGCQTVTIAAGEEWDDATPGDALDDIREATEKLEAQGTKPNTLVLCSHDLRSILKQDAVRDLLIGPMGEKGMGVQSLGTILPELKVYVQRNKVNATDILSDKAIVMEVNVDYGAIYEYEGLSSKNWVSEDPPGRWLMMWRNCLPIRTFANAVCVISNTKA